MSTVFLAAAIICAGWGIISQIKIVNFLSARGHKINFFLIRLLIIKYVHDYRVITTEENGRAGPWFYSYVTAMTLTIVFAVAGIILR